MGGKSGTEQLDIEVNEDRSAAPNEKLTRVSPMQ